MNTYDYYNGRAYKKAYIPCEITVYPKLSDSEIALAKKIVNEIALLVIQGNLSVRDKVSEKYGSYGMELVENYLKTL